MSGRNDIRLAQFDQCSEPIVITGIGIMASVGETREQVWQAIRQGRSGVKHLTGLTAIPDNLLVGASLDIESEIPNQIKTITMCERTAAEALEDSGADMNRIDPYRFGCAISAHMGDHGYFDRSESSNGSSVAPVPWYEQCLPNSACWHLGHKFGLYGPRIAHSTACASGLIEVLGAVRAIRDGQCDIALAGSGESIDPLFAAGFHNMRVLAYDDDPTKAARPFDRNRSGFVLGEGAAMFVVERLSHAIDRGAKIYAEISAGKMLAQAHHVTGLDTESDSLSYLIKRTVNHAGLDPTDIGYINAHGTGTLQNDVSETRAIRSAFGSAADRVSVSSIKSMLGHLVNASGSVELALTALAMRDGFVPPTLNLCDPDPECDLDCIPLVGRRQRFQHALKLSVAFGGHLVAVALSRWNEARSGFAYPHLAEAA